MPAILDHWVHELICCFKSEYQSIYVCYSTSTYAITNPSLMPLNSTSVTSHYFHKYFDHGQQQS
ncbi:hypothetical protein HanHA89_Chr17g0724791 [Helianthus annuus]|nr:hypothetical protein HanHA89_Chr17g0724791 [Helianthus annuus]